MKFRYCTECAAPLEQRDATEYVCANGHEYWNEPHASACVAVLKLSSSVPLEPVVSAVQWLLCDGARGVSGQVIHCDSRLW